MSQIIIRISGNALDISPDGKSALPDDVCSLLEPNLRYNYVKILRGQDAYGFDGVRRPVRSELRLLYTYDRYGRMVTGVGFLTRITRLLTSDGYSVITEDVTPAHPRTDRYFEDWDNVVRNFDFRARQDEMLTQISTYPRGIIDAVTGFGKSFACKAICLLYPKANTIITTKSKDVVQAIRMQLSKDIPNVGQIGGGVNKLGRITVVTADSLHRVNAAETDILLADEVHQLAAPSYSAELAKFRCARMYGFSASSTGRMDNADIKLESLFGPVIFSMSYPEAVELGLVVPIHVRWLDMLLSNNPAADYDDVPRLRHGIWRNVERNAIIAQAARGFDTEDQVLIMVTTFDHAVHLRQHLPEYTLCYAERHDDKAFDRFVKKKMLPADEPKMDSKRRQLLRQQFERGELKKVIATDVWSTGVSFDQLAVLIRADARGSTIMDTQIPGRVCRLHNPSDKKFGLVIDCLDQFDRNFNNSARKRRRNYAAKGWSQEQSGNNRHIVPS